MEPEGQRIAPPPASVMAVLTLHEAGAKLWSPAPLVRAGDTLRDAHALTDDDLVEVLPEERPPPPEEPQAPPSTGATRERRAILRLWVLAVVGGCALLCFFAALRLAISSVVHHVREQPVARAPRSSAEAPRELDVAVPERTTRLARKR